MLKEYRSKVHVRAIQNLGRDNEEELLEWFQETGIRFEIIGEFKFRIMSDHYPDQIWSFGEWLVMWDRNFTKVMDNVTFHNRYMEV